MMYLKQSSNRKTGRTYLSMVHGYRDKEKGYSRTRTVESFGYLDELEKIYSDPISHFQKYVDERNQAEKQEAAEYTVTARKDQKLAKNTSTRLNYGYIVIMSLYYELGFDRFLINRQRRQSKIECNTSTIMKMLLVNRILSPGSKKRAFDERGRYFDFEKEDAFDLTDVYRSLSFFAKLEEDIQLLMHDRIEKNYGRNMELVYYDTTNFYFEIDTEDELRKKGVSKEHRPNPIVQLGLTMDADGLPISYEVFAGNESEKLYLRPAVFELYSKYGCRKVIAVADSAQNTGNNIYYLDHGKQGYVFSQSIRGGSKAFKAYVVDETGYEWYGDEYKRKSRVERREIFVDFDGKDGKTHKKKKLVDQRQIVFYSEKYAVRSRTLREAAIKKAEKIIANPSAYTKATSYGCLKYIMNVEVDKETGEIKEGKRGQPCFNLDAIKEEEKYDGYYAIVTNLFDEGEDKGKFGDAQIIDIYRGLWRIEESFGITKGELEARPVFLSRGERIRAHFLICYIALVIVRLIQKRTGYEYSPEKLIDAMNNISCSHEGGNLYLFDYRSDVCDSLGEAFGIDFTLERLTRGEIKKSLGSVKKT
jgi:transposase